jgi:hypothetical protein
MLLSVAQGAELTDRDESTRLSTQIRMEVNRILDKFRRDMDAYYQRTRVKKRMVPLGMVEAEDTHYYLDGENKQESQQPIGEANGSDKTFTSEMPGEAARPNTEEEHGSENRQSTRPTNSTQSNPQEKTELGQYLRHLGIKYIHHELIPLATQIEKIEGQPRTATSQEALIYLLLQEMWLKNSPNDERDKLEKERAENVRKGLLSTEDRNLDELVTHNSDLIQFTAAFKEKNNGNLPPLDEILIHLLFKKNFNREPTDAERAEIKKHLPPLGWLNFIELNQRAKEIVEKEQRTILGPDASEEDIQEGLRLGGLATKEQIEASKQATRILTHDQRFSGKAPEEQIDRLHHIDEVDTWIYMRDTLKLNVDMYGHHFKTLYYPMIKRFKERGIALPHNWDEFEDERLKIEEEDKAKEAAEREKQNKDKKELIDSLSREEQAILRGADPSKFYDKLKRLREQRKTLEEKIK